MKIKYTAQIEDTFESSGMNKTAQLGVSYQTYLPEIVALCLN